MRSLRCTPCFEAAELLAASLLWSLSVWASAWVRGTSSTHALCRVARQASLSEAHEHTLSSSSIIFKSFCSLVHLNGGSSASPGHQAHHVSRAARASCDARSASEQCHLHTRIRYCGSHKSLDLQQRYSKNFRVLHLLQRGRNGLPLQRCWSEDTSNGSSQATVRAEAMHSSSQKAGCPHLPHLVCCQM